MALAPRGPAAWAVLGLLALPAPGVGLMVAAWLGVRRLALRSGADALILATGASARRGLGDLVERRLANLVEEMAIAAGVPRLRVMVVEGDGSTPPAAPPGTTPRSSCPAAYSMPSGATPPAPWWSTLLAMARPATWGWP